MICHLLWLLLLICTSYCKNIYISSTGEDAETCGGSVQSPCQSLNYATITNDSNIIINGTITVDSVVKFIALTNLIFSPLNDATVAILQCTTNGTTIEGDIESGLIFESCYNISLTNIHIIQCSVNHQLSSEGDLYSYQAGIMMNHTTNIYIDSVSISDSIGTGLLLFNSGGNIEITDSIFSDNYLPYNWSNVTDSNFVHGGAGLVILISACDLMDKNCTLNSVHGNYIIHHSYFINNMVNLTSLTDDRWLLSYGGGLAILLLWNVFGNSFDIRYSNFTGNKASCGAGFIWHCQKLCSDNIVTINNCLFTENSLAAFPFGGAGMALGISSHQNNLPNNNLFTIKNTLFTKNNGYYAAGTLIYSSAVSSTESLPYTSINHIHFINCSWDSNTGIVSPAVEIEPDFRSQQSKDFLIKTTFEDCNITNNSIVKHYRSSSYTFNKEIGVFLISRLKVYFKGRTIFENNHGTALYLSTGSAIFESTSCTIFTNNTGTKGGAITLIGYSNIQYKNDTQFVFTRNYASIVGGAIYVLNIKPHSAISSHSCFLEYSDNNVVFNIRNARFIFDENHSGSGLAHSIYLPSIYPCRLTCLRYSTPIPSNNETFTNSSCLGTFYFSNYMNQIATDGSVFKVLEDLPLVIIPGRKYSLPIQLIDDMHQDVTSIAVFQMSISTPNITISRGFDIVADNTIELLGKPRESGNLTLTIASFDSVGTSIGIVLSPCPPGYITDNTTCTCSATQNTAFVYHGITGCREREEVAIVIPGYWVGYIFENENEEPNQDNLYTSDCPLGFCHYFTNSTGPSNRYYSLTNSSSPQKLEAIVCTANRHNTLCSQCKDGYSVYFHSNTALCGSNTLCPWGPIFYILSELVPITILFITILYFNISLTTGSAYSLIFIIQLLQAMIVSVNGAVHFNPPFIRNTYTIIYNMLNLDFFDIDELSFCLWKGAGTLDMIAMKYVSVIYAILLIMGFIFLFNNCSCRIKSWRSRENSINSSMGKIPRRKYSAIHGLTSFLVICYFQCSRITFLLLNRETPRGIGGKHYKNLVFWDGTLEYFHGRHLLYAIPALLCLLLFVIPLPLVLMFDQYLLKLESFIAPRLSFIRRTQPCTLFHNKIKPLVDSFQGTFKDKYRFFSGLYFAYRIVILAALVLSATALQFYFVFEVIIILIIIIQATIQPFQKRRDNIIALVIFSNMALINAITLRVYDLVSDQGYTGTTVLLQWIQMGLIYSPLVTIVCWGMWQGYKTCLRKTKRGYSTFEETTEKDNDFPEEIFDRSSNSYF